MRLRAGEQLDAADEVREGPRPPRPSQLIRGVRPTRKSPEQTQAGYRLGG
jgi:hypothetical protein